MFKVNAKLTFNRAASKKVLLGFCWGSAGVLLGFCWVLLGFCCLEQRIKQIEHNSERRSNPI